MAEQQTPTLSKVVGVLGGMGPAATVDFYAKLVRHTPAQRDQDHLRVVIWADPTVPSRQEALLAGGTDPTPWLEEGVRHLVGSGAQIVVVPCNTIHAYLGPVLADQPVEFLSIIDTTVRAIQRRDARRVGLLATDGALASGVFQAALDAAGIEW
ncbi:MAG: aspartate/glutamate racemase family protein, partial [Actinobacteria bacterium]|nr:aspartate/glutamate racemase family protein [Actinomycetota bacterium]